MILQKAKDPDYKEIMTVNKKTGETQIGEDTESLLQTYP